MADLSALSHQWRDAREPGSFAPWWTCPKCLLGSASPFDALCPDLVSQALDRAHAERDQLRATLGAIGQWTHTFGAALVPGGGSADTYGDGVRDAKAQVAHLLTSVVGGVR